ncbi:hypothetical protein LOTGIDRAFT_227187 [Lottia gigantea]|uniref:Protein-tyrosine-phosphatase n=1 Tax=Lottia gigantea TaxID=225164 RepID=V4AG57_LOTGI|nr:hypothetical protein LOTGIDRAFT_227187 [Lottia gigantea]ESO95857.1 hypothetical protein LOTGIDRAFT_227187 [Lottia gigantea]
MNDSNISLLTPRDDTTDQKTPRYESPRKIPLSIPDKLTDDWLESLPLLSIREDGEEFVGEVLHSLVEKVEQEEPYEEFRNLCQLKPTDDCTASNLTDNKIKNRYRNVLPYDVNRVKLKGSKNDYINASYINIDIEDTQLRYIACQGPLPNTVDDFWLMCWQEEVSVVAMLTLDVESRRVKCHRYWPDSPIETLDICDGEYEVNLKSSQSLNDIDIRYINITHCPSGKIKHIIHLNYTTWPDHGTPQSAIPILQFLRLLHLLHTGGPIVVHCSAGIGRSGSLMTIDIALLYMEHMLPFNIFEIVKYLRQQKYGMIQTKDQYLFCYTACMQVLLSVAG